MNSSIMQFQRAIANFRLPALQLGRTSDAEITVFDSTGLAIQDVAAAAIAYGRYVTAGSLSLEPEERGNQC